MKYRPVDLSPSSLDHIDPVEMALTAAEFGSGIPTLDLHGQRVDEALRAVDRLIDQAIVQDASVMKIITGKGSGVLRQAVHTFLKKHASVERFRDAHGNQMGAVTVIKIRL